jgi:hypothetical protein
MESWISLYRVLRFSWGARKYFGGLRKYIFALKIKKSTVL